MAGNMDSLQESLTCPVCFEDFEKNGDHVPRLLPCTHSLCHTCISQWIRNNRLECPTCRIRHEARQDEITFPQNKYILTMMRRRTRLEGNQIDEFTKCPKHGENEILFCRETGCKKMVCPLCLAEAHLGHKVVAIKDETKEVLAQLVQKIENTSKTLNTKIRKYEDASQDVLKKTEANVLQITMEKEKMIRDLENKKDEMIKQYDEMMKQAEDEKTKLGEASDNELTAMKDNVELLSNIKLSIEEEENTYEDALKKLDTVKGVTENVKGLPRVKKYEYSEYILGQENLVGKLIRKEKFFFTPELQLRGQGQYTA